MEQVLIKIAQLMKVNYTLPNASKNKIFILSRINFVIYSQILKKTVVDKICVQLLMFVWRKY